MVPVRVSLSNLQNPRANGFQMAAYDGSNRVLAGWTSIDGDTSVTSNHVNQTKPGNRTSAWQVYFRTPASPTAFTIYTAGLDGNATGVK